jgi:hypothetical protein
MVGHTLAEQHKQFPFEHAHVPNEMPKLRLNTSQGSRVAVVLSSIVLPALLHATACTVAVPGKHATGYLLLQNLPLRLSHRLAPSLQAC